MLLLLELCPTPSSSRPSISRSTILTRSITTTAWPSKSLEMMKDPPLRPLPPPPHPPRSPPQLPRSPPLLLPQRLPPRLLPRLLTQSPRVSSRARLPLLKRPRLPSPPRRSPKPRLSQPSRRQRRRAQQPRLSRPLRRLRRERLPRRRRRELSLRLQLMPRPQKIRRSTTL